MFNIFSKTRRSDEIIKRYVKGIVNQEEFLDNEHGMVKSDLISILNKAVKDFLRNASIDEADEDRMIREFKIFASFHDLTYEKSQKIFAEILELALSNKTIISEYNQESVGSTS